jgi:hypothetical protein
VKNSLTARSEEMLCEKLMLCEKRKSRAQKSRKIIRKSGYGILWRVNLPMTLAVPKNGMLRYNATCTNCGESYIFTDSTGNIIKFNNEYDCGICNAKKL